MIQFSPVRSVVSLSGRLISSSTATLGCAVFAIENGRKSLSLENRTAKSDCATGGEAALPLRRLGCCDALRKAHGQECVQSHDILYTVLSGHAWHFVIRTSFTLARYWCAKVGAILRL